jgi:hypothetical protein
MADQTFGNKDQTGPASAHGFEKAANTAANTAKSVSDQALSVGRDLKDKATGLAGASSEAIKDQASEFVDAAKDVASQATDKIRQAVDGQKVAGAEYVGNLADTMRRAAREFDADLPIAGVYIRKAASQVESVADSIKTGNVNDLVRGAQSFARRQPTAFLGLAVLAGFGVVRFLKSSANTSGSAAAGPRPGGGQRFAENTANRPRPNGTPNGSYSSNRGYRDEFGR